MSVSRDSNENPDIHYDSLDVSEGEDSGFHHNVNMPNSTANPDTVDYGVEQAFYANDFRDEAVRKQKEQQEARRNLRAIRPVSDYIARVATEAGIEAGLSAAIKGAAESEEAAGNVLVAPPERLTPLTKEESPITRRRATRRDAPTIVVATDSGRLLTAGHRPGPSDGRGRLYRRP